MRRFVYVAMMIDWFFLLLDDTPAELQWRHEMTRKLPDAWHYGPSRWPRDIPLVLPRMTGRWIIAAPGAAVLRREKGEEIRKNFSNFFLFGTCLGICDSRSRSIWSRRVTCRRVDLASWRKKRRTTTFYDMTHTGEHRKNHDQQNQVLAFWQISAFRKIPIKTHNSLLLSLQSDRNSVRLRSGALVWNQICIVRFL